MREIKFRGKRLDNGEWVYGTLCMSAICPPYIIWVGDDSVVIDIPIINQDTICQFTGLCDCNGKEIYEGDILDTMTSKYDSNGYSFICKWIDSGFALIYQGKTYGVKVQNNFFNRYQLCKKNVEDLVIKGNVHDNPELLKE